jgi:hypothetical protein
MMKPQSKPQSSTQQCPSVTLAIPRSGIRSPKDLSNSYPVSYRFCLRSMFALRSRVKFDFIANLQYGTKRLSIPSKIPPTILVAIVISIHDSTCRYIHGSRPTLDRVRDLSRRTFFGRFGLHVNEFKQFVPRIGDQFRKPTMRQSTQFSPGICLCSSFLP